MVNVQLPPGATQERTLAVMQQVEGFMLKQPEVQSMVGVLGFSFSGQGQNAGLAFVTLKDWDERKDPATPPRAGRACLRCAVGHPRCLHLPAEPAAHSRTGQRQRLQLPAAGPRRRGHEALVNARNQLLGMAGQSKVLTQVRPDGLEDAPQLQIDIDRDKANALGVTFDAINRRCRPRWARLRQRLPEPRPPAARGGAGRRAGAHAARRPAAAERQQQPGQAGAAVGLRDHQVGHRRDADGALQRLPGDAHQRRRRARLQHGRRDGRDGKARRAAAAGFGFEWTGQSREEKLAGSQAIILYGFAILAVFLCLAALYESWSIPLAVILVVPLGVLGVLLATMLRGYANDVYFQVGLITIIGLSAKNAILIIEFAKDLQAQGKGVSKRRWPRRTCGSARS
jgi:multidrug efflux pump